MNSNIGLIDLSRLCDSQQLLIDDFIYFRIGVCSSALKVKNRWRLLHSHVLMSENCNYNFIFVFIGYNGWEHALQKETETYRTTCWGYRWWRYPLLREMHGLLGIVLWLFKNMGTLHLLLLLWISLQNCPTGTWRSLSEIREIFTNCFARSTLYQPMHLNFGHHQHENQSHGSRKTSNILNNEECDHQGQCFHQYWCFCLLSNRDS